MTPRRWLAPVFLGGVAAMCAALWVFLATAEEVFEGETGQFDTWMLLALHPPGPAGQPVNPAWLDELARDITSLGSGTVLGLIVVATVGALALLRKYRTAVFVLAATVPAHLANSLLKSWYRRPRPELIPHDILVSSSSFPSGHAMVSAAVYLTLGSLLARLAPTTGLRIYVLGLATALTGFVGFSRIYLGVHWPSDVLAGWAAGAAWALAAWLIAETWRVEDSTGQ